jgi:hypothetical protein
MRPGCKAVLAAHNNNNNNNNTASGSGGGGDDGGGGCDGGAGGGGGERENASVNIYSTKKYLMCLYFEISLYEFNVEANSCM